MSGYSPSYYAEVEERVHKLNEQLADTTSQSSLRPIQVVARSWWTWKKGGARSRKPTERSRSRTKKSAKTGERLKYAILLLFSLTAVGAIAAFFVYQAYDRRAKDVAFEARFREDASSMLARLGANMDSMLSATDAFVLSMVSSARATNQTWPFVTIDDFAVGAGKLLKNSRSKYITTYHVVQERERKTWEKYTAEHNGWVEKSLEVQNKAQGRTYFGPTVDEKYMKENYSGHYDLIHDYDEAVYGGNSTDGVDHKGPYLPIWQCSPVIPIDPIYNWDVMANPTDVLLSVQGTLDSHLATITPPYMINWPDDLEAQKYNEDCAEWWKPYLEPDEDAFAPVYDLFYPLLVETVDRVNYFEEGYSGETYQRSSYDKDESKIGAVFCQSIYWRDTLRDLLPSGSEGVMAVFENECDSPPFAYEITGPTPKYLGTGLFESKFSDLAIETGLLDVWDFGIAKSTYTGIPVNEKICPYKITVYPAESAKEQFLSNNDDTVFTILVVVLSVIVLGIVSTLAFFFYYNRHVENQIKAKILMQKQQAQRYRNIFATRVAKTIKVKAGANELSPELLKAQFEAVDRDTSGSISKDELWEFMSSGKAGTIDRSDFDALWVVIDADDSGTIDFLEFCAFLADCHVDHETTREDKRSLIAAAASKRFTAEDLE